LTRRHDVASLAQLEKDGRVVARLDGREIGVVRDPASGELWALRNRCPHHGAPLCLGSIKAREAGGLPGSYEVGERRVLRCPWHGWEFDPQDGRCLDDPSMRVATYPVRVRDGRVEVEA
jgi:3-phenylpropionate/trans-cinnamate dioxygenase ferredoxin subunit